MLREEGVRHVSSFSQPLDAAGPMRDVTPEDADVPGPMAVDVEPEPLDNVVALSPAAEDAEETDAPGSAEAPPEAPSEPFVLRPAPSDRPAVPVEAEPAEDDAPEPAGDAADEAIPEFSFLRRARPAEPPSEDAEPQQTDLFASRRTSAPADPAPPPPERPRIPPTPDVAATDAPDDDAATPALPGFAARLVVWDIRPDHAAIAQAVADLRAARARL
jgi:hypothetical protein